MAITYHSGRRLQGLSTDNVVTTSLSLSELLAYYNFDETSGTVLTNQAGTAGSSDSLGTSVNGTNVGTATVNQTGKIDKTYDFDGSGTGASYDHIAIPNALGTDLAGTNKLSYSLWFNTDEFSTSQGNAWDLIGTYGSSGGADYRGLTIDYWYDGTFNIYPEYHTSITRSYGKISLANLGATDTGTWYHLVVVYDGTATGDANRLKIYLNGVQKTFDSFQGADSVPATINFGGYPTWIGRPSYSSTYQKNFNGKIDEVTIWKRALTDDEVLGLYNGGEGATPNTAKSGFESKPTNVQVGSRWEETDTRKMYNYAYPLTFEDDFSSDNWTDKGSMGVSGGTLTGANVLDNGDDTSYYDLTSTSDTNWILRFKGTYTTTYGTGNSSKMLFVGLSSDTNAMNTAKDFAGFIFEQWNAPQFKIAGGVVNNATLELASSLSNLSALDTTSATTVTNYFEIKRDGNDFTFTVYSNSDYSTGQLSTVTRTVSSVTTLQYLTFTNRDISATNTGSLTVSVDDLKFYNGVTSTSNIWKELGT